MHLEPMPLFVVSHSYGKEECADGFPVGPFTALLCGAPTQCPPSLSCCLPALPGAPISIFTPDGVRVEGPDLTPCSYTGIRNQLLPPRDDLGGGYSLTWG